MKITLAQYKAMQRQVWTAGDYAAIAMHLEEAAADLVHRLDVMPGMRVLDVATGTGNAAIRAAKVGSEVTGVDLCPELFDAAQERADSLGLSVEWREADAESLPFRDAVFDRVLSTFGVAFAPRHRQAAREFARVLRPGGRFGMANWTHSGAIGLLYDVFGRYLPPPPDFATPAWRWGEPDHVREMFDGLDAELEFAWGSVPVVFADPDDCLSFLEEVSGPLIAAKAQVTANGDWPRVRAELEEGLRPMVREDIGGCWINAEYLIVTGRRAR